MLFGKPLYSRCWVLTCAEMAVVWVRSRFFSVSATDHVFRYLGSGFGFRVSGLGFRVSGFRISVSGFTVRGFEVRV